MGNNKDYIDYNTGITSEVLTIKSKTKTIDIINYILKIKANEVNDWINSLDNVSKNDVVVILGAYLTGVAIAKKIASNFKKIILIDINIFLENFIFSDICEYNSYHKSYNNIFFTNNLDLINDGKIVIDTTGFGGLSVHDSSKINCKAFLIEDPTSDANDILLQFKNNIHDRLNMVQSENKAILKTEGLNTKTSGTMTLTVDILNKSINDSLKHKGVLYSIGEMTFFEDIIFKEKNFDKFFDLTNKSALKVSTVDLFNIDKSIKYNLNQITSYILKK